MFKRLLVALGAITLLTVALMPASLLAHEGREVGHYEVTVGFLTEPAFEGQVNGAYIRIMKPAEEHSNGAVEGPDLETHGGLFASGTVEAGGSFEYTFGEELAGLTVPYHDHLTGQSGTVAVAHGAELSGTVMVEFVANDGFVPASITVQPGTTVMFMNTASDEVMTVLSGPHSDNGHEHGTETTEEEAHEHVGVTGLSETLEVDVTHIATSTTKTMSLRRIFGEDGAYSADFVPTAPGGYTFRFFGEVEGMPFDESFTSGPNTFDEIQPASNVQFPIELRAQRELQGAVEGVQADVVLASDKADDADSIASMALVVGIVGIVAGVAGAGIGGYSLLSSRRKS